MPIGAGVPSLSTKKGRSVTLCDGVTVTSE